MFQRLTYIAGNSAKFYEVHLESVNGLYNVVAAYGRIGNSPSTALKTPSPVDYDTAVEMANKLCLQKQKKGYQPTEIVDSETPFITSTTEVAAPQFYPQLSNPITESELLSRAANERFGVQLKKDGVRLVLYWNGSAAVALNRRGVPISGSAVVMRAFERVCREGQYTSLRLDAEGFEESAYIFDLLELNGQDLMMEPFETRQRILLEIQSDFDVASDGWLPSPLTFAHTWWTDIHDLERLIDSARADAEEGLILRRDTALYEAGRGNKDVLKLKNVNSATAFVTKHSAGKRSVAVALTNPDGTTREMGNVTIPANYEIPTVGALVEVQYLWVLSESDGAFIQPVYKGERDDQTLDACTTDQLVVRSDSAISRAS